MNTFHFGPIDKRLVHKQKEDNVFVRDLRRSVPALLEKKTVEEIILPSLSPGDFEFFGEYFQPWVTEDGKPSYVLFNLPRRLPTSFFDEENEAGPFTISEKKTLLRSFVPNPGTNTSSLKAPESEMEVTILENILGPKGLALVEEDLVRLANLLERLPNLAHEEVFHAGLRVLPTHPYFFEHSNEHVPGMMLLEAGRQFALACWHQFGGIPLRGCQFIMNELHSKFHDYVDLNYPAIFRAEATSLKKKANGEWSEVTLAVAIQQKGSVCCEMEFPARVVSKRSFQRLRVDRDRTDPLHRFYPIENIHHAIVLWDPVHASYHKAKLWDVSMEGFRVEILNLTAENLPDTLWEMLLYFEEVGFIRSFCLPTWQKSDGEVHYAGFKFHEMNPEDHSLLQTAIRQYCYLRRERGQL